MKIDQLRYFLETAKQGHIGRAANIVAISPSAISHSIAALEKELGRELFTKKGKNIVLTSHGKLLMERAKRLLEAEEAIREELSSDQVELQGHYKLAATHGLCAEYLAPAWTRVQSGRARLTGEVYSLRSAQVIAGAALGEFDLGLCYSPQPHPALEARRLCEGRLLLAVAKTHPLLKRDSRQAAKELSGFPACLPKAFQGIENCEAHPAFARHGIVPDARFIFDSYDAAVAHIASSRSWGLIPEWIVRRQEHRLSAIVPSGWRAPVFVSAVWPKSRLLTRALKGLMSELERRLPLSGRCAGSSRSSSPHPPRRG